MFSGYFFFFFFGGEREEARNVVWVVRGEGGFYQMMCFSKHLFFELFT